MNYETLHGALSSNVPQVSQMRQAIGNQACTCVARSTVGCLASIEENLYLLVINLGSRFRGKKFSNRLARFPVISSLLYHRVRDAELIPIIREK